MKSSLILPNFPIIHFLKSFPIFQSRVGEYEKKTIKGSTSYFDISNEIALISISISLGNVILASFILWTICL